MRSRFSGWLSRLRPRTRPATAEPALQRYLLAASGSLEQMPVGTFLAGAIAFYRDEPVTGIATDDGADMLLFQYGSYDWGDGTAFEIDVTRQFAHDHDGTLSQLQATAYFAPDPALAALGAYDTWCERRADADAFARAVLASPGIAAVRTRSPLRRVIRWEMV